MNSLAIRRELSSIEKAERILDLVFGKQEKIPLRYWPEDEEDLDNLEIVCDHKFMAEYFKFIGMEIPEEDIYFACSECDGHNDRGCKFYPDYYRNNQED
jgi:hypothetical protein